MANTTEYDPKTAVYTPTEVATYGVEAIKKARENKLRGIGINIAGIRDYFAPLMPGQVCGIIAQTSNYKSGFLHFIEHEAAKLLVEQKRTDEILVHVSVEEGVEEQAFLEFARESGEDAGKLARGQVQDWDKLIGASAHVMGIPIYRIGDSLARADDMPNLYMSNMIRAIRSLQTDILDWKPKIAGIFFDYLQAFPIDPETKNAAKMDQRRLQVRDDVFRLRQAANYFDCPVYVAIQAKQHLDGARPPIMLPGVYDGEETSSIAQRLDRVISLWMPKQTNPIGYTVNTGDGSYFKVEENQLWVKVCKQRGGLPAGKTWPCIVDFRRNTIAPQVKS
jgi:replicative DNA helicase